MCAAASTAARADDCLPYRAFWIDDIDPSPMSAVYINGGEQERLFPLRTLRFHLNSQRVIAGTTLVTRTSGSTTQQVHRASVWRYDGGSGSLPSGWKRIPLEPEPGSATTLLETPFESLVGGMNDLGVVGGGKSWHPTAMWMVTPATWDYDPSTDSVTTHRLGTTGSSGQQQSYQSNYTPGMVCAVGAGAEPRVGGWVFTRCGGYGFAPFTASLADSTLAVSELDGLFSGFPNSPNPPKGRVSALPSNGSGPAMALGYAHGGQCFGPNVGVCVSDYSFNSWTTRWQLGSSTWALSALAEPFADTYGFDFKLFDSTGTLGGGYVRWFGSPFSGECDDHAAVFYDPISTSNAAYDIHGALDYDGDRPRSRVAAVADVNASLSKWLAVGSQYAWAETNSPGAGGYDSARGVIWKSRAGGEGSVEWCGRKIETLCRELPAELIHILAVTDVLPGGAAVGYGRLLSGGTPPSGWGSPGGKLILFTAAADYNGDLHVDGADLGVLLGTWNTTDSHIDLDCAGVVDGADLGILLGAWASGSSVARVDWSCRGWTAGTLVEAAEEASRVMGFGGLESMGDYLSAVSPSEAVGTAEVAAILTQAFAGGGE